MRKFFAILACTLTFHGIAVSQTPEELVRRLAAPDARDRRLAAEALGKQKIEAAIPALAELVKDKDPDVRRAAADALVGMGGKAAPALGKALAFPEAASRLAALQALIAIGAEAKSALDPVTKALTDKDVDVRIHAATLLGNLGSSAKPALPALTAAAKDLGNLGPSLRPRLPTNVAEAAIVAALRIDPASNNELAKAAVPALVAGLQSSDGATAQAASSALARLGPSAKDALPALKEAQGKAKGFAADTITRAIGAIGASSPLADVIRDPKAPLEKRLDAMFQVSWSGKDDSGIPALLAVLSDPNPQVRAGAVSSLRSLGPKAKPALPGLLDLLGDVALEQAAASMRRGTDVVVTALVGIGKDAVPGLVGVLEDQSKKPVARWGATRALAGLGRRARAALPALEAATKDRVAVIAIEAAGAYVLAGGELGKVTPLFKVGLKHATPVVAYNTVRVVHQLGPRASATAPELLALLDHKEEEVRILAAHAVSHLGPDAGAAIPTLAKRLREGSLRERVQVATALANMGPIVSEALPALLEQLKDPWAMGNHPVLTTIGNLGPRGQDAVPILVELLKKEDWLAHGEVITTLGRIGAGAKSGVPPLTAYLQHKKADKRALAARALGEMGVGAAIPTLQPLLQDEDKEVRVWAAFALARLQEDSDRYAKLLVEMWQEERPRVGPGGGMVRFNVAEACRLLGERARAVQPLLLAAVLDQETPLGTRTRAAKALGTMGSEAKHVVPPLIKLLEQHQDDGPDLNGPVLAMQLLGDLGAGASDAIPLLRRLQDSEANTVADAATQALTKLESK